MSTVAEDLSGCDLSGNIDVSGNIPTRNEIVYPEENSEEQSIVEQAWGLRLRSRIDQLTADLSGNFPPTPQLRLNELYFESVVYFLRFMNLTGQFLQFLWLLFGNIGKGIRKSVKDDIYVFFKDSSYPYSVLDVQLTGSGTPEIEWYYNASTRTFLTSRLYTNSQTYHTHHIPYLTAEVKYNDLILYDISDFINSVRWAGVDDPSGHQSETMPNVDHLISAWSLSSGVVLKRSSSMNLCVINTDGEEVKLPLRNEA